MNQVEAISLVKRIAPTVGAMEAIALFVFDSTGRDMAKPKSDLDLFIDHDPAQKFCLSELIGIQQSLEQAFSIAIDLTTCNSLHPCSDPI